MKQKQGFTLIELLIALSISMLILSCLGIVLVAEKNSYDAQLSLNDMQENIRILANLLKSEVNLAGDIGCAKLSDNFPIYNKTSINFSRMNKVNSYLDKNRKPDTEGFTVLRMDIGLSTLVKSMHSMTDLYITGEEEYEIGDVMMISDCKSVDIFFIKSIFVSNDGVKKIVAKMPLSKKYSTDSMVGKLLKNSYFIKLDEEEDLDKPMYSLFVKNVNNQEEEMLKGVDDMKIVLDKKDDSVVGVDVGLAILVPDKYVDRKQYHLYFAVH